MRRVVFACLVLLPCVLAVAAVAAPYGRCLTKRGKPRRATLAHRDHVHIGLSRPGARMRTSFWR